MTTALNARKDGGETFPLCEFLKVMAEAGQDAFADDNNWV
jgi:hypothetical protein